MSCLDLAAEEELLELEEAFAPPALCCANCGYGLERHTVKTPLGMGCPAHACMAFVPHC